VSEGQCICPRGAERQPLGPNAFLCIQAPPPDDGPPPDGQGPTTGPRPGDEEQPQLQFDPRNLLPRLQLPQPQ
jgi:hypothetical protein